MNLSIRKLFAVAAACAVLAAAPAVQAASPLTWTIDSQQSSIGLTIPNFAFGSFTLGLGSQNGTYPWTIGSVAPVGGTIDTLYDDGVSIEFLSGQTNVLALNSGSYLPDPAAWNGTGYGNPASNNVAPAAYGNFVLEVNFGLPLAATALRNVHFELASPAMPLAGGTTFNGTQTALGFNPGSVIDTLSTQFSLSGLPNGFNTSIAGAAGANTALAGTVTPLGPLTRELVVPVVNVPFVVSFDLGASGILNVPGTMNGQIVAHAAIPEPSTFVLAGMGAIGLALAARRRWKVRR